jgi:Putative bacterial sensory transduction regulator
LIALLWPLASVVLFASAFITPRIGDGRLREETRLAHLKIASRLIALAVIVWLAAAGQVQTQSKPNAGPDIVALLEKSGHSYTKVSDSVWEVDFQGKNIKQIPVRVTLAPGILVTMCKLVDRKSLRLEPALLIKLMELNNDFDYVKLALTEDMLYVRMDTLLRLLDSDELNHALEQVSAAAEEAYPHISPFIATEK